MKTVTVYYSDDDGMTICTLLEMDRDDAPGYLGNVTLERVRAALKEQRVAINHKDEPQFDRQG
jgi:hypothetical protein